MSLPVSFPALSRLLLIGILCLSLDLIGCGGSGSTTTSPGNSSPVLTLSASSLTFTATTVGSSSAAQTVTLTNSGSAVLNFTGITLSDTTNYSLSTTCGAYLASGGSCSASIIFTPKSAASLAATITLSDNASPSTQTITLSGSGTGVPALTLSTSTLAFAAATVNTSSAAQSVTLTSSGTGSLAIGSITLSDTTNYSFSTTCGLAVAPGNTCAVSVTFTPASTGSHPAAITISTNASPSTQTVNLSGSGTAAPAPALTLSTMAVSFTSTAVGSSTTGTQVTLSNTGTASLTLNSVVLNDTKDFSLASTCGTSLAVGASCVLTPSFTPQSAGPLSGTITITDNATPSTAAVTLSGTATSTSTVTHTLYTFPESDNSVTPLYAFVNGATKTIDMTMYELQDTTFDNDLIAACNRGVRVRVILSSSEKSNNAPAYAALNTAGSNCSAVYSNTAFTNTHQKTITIDNASTAIMTLNLQSQYYSTTRDFALVENDSADIAAIEATFAADYAAGTPYGGSQGASDFSYTPTLGDDLIWSPTTAQAAMESLINNAKSTLLIENEELASSASYIVNDLVAACQRGVVVHFTIVDQSSYEAQFTTIKNAGCSVHTYPDTTTGFYVHAKVVVADYGLSTQNVYMGSINYSNASMNQNRELGMYLSDNAAVQTLYSTLTSDYNGGTPW